MLLEATIGRSRAFVIVLGNEKGGSGKSTTAMHLAIALSRAGQRVATIDLDPRQKTLTHYIDNRTAWSRRKSIELPIPNHFCVLRHDGPTLFQNEEDDFRGLEAILRTIENSHDFVVIDTPGSDTYGMRLAHAMADALVTPLNDSFLDFDVLGAVDSETFSITATGHYTDMVAEARRQRRAIDGGALDWIVIRNRVSPIAKRKNDALSRSLTELGLSLGFRHTEGLTERGIYRDLFPKGLTALDEFGVAAPSSRAAVTVSKAQNEVRALVEALRLPINEKGKRRAVSRAEFVAAADRPLELEDILD